MNDMVEKGSGALHRISKPGIIQSADLPANATERYDPQAAINLKRDHWSKVWQTATADHKELMAQIDRDLEEGGPVSPFPLPSSRIPTYRSRHRIRCRTTSRALGAGSGRTKK